MQDFGLLMSSRVLGYWEFQDLGLFVWVVLWIWVCSSSKALQSPRQALQNV